MKTSLKFIVAAGIGFGGVGLAASSVSAMPMSGLDPAVATPSDTAKNFESVRWVCGPYGGCRWVAGWRRHWWGYGWGPGSGYGYYHPWRHYGWGPYTYRGYGYNYGGGYGCD